MNDNQILDQNIIPKPPSDCWKGARYFGYGVACVIGAYLVLEILTRLGIIKTVEPEMDAWVLLPIFTFIIFIFFNIAGFIISLDYALTGNNTREKVAGLVSLLINIIPFLGFLYFLISLASYESNL